MASINIQFLEGGPLPLPYLLFYRVGHRPTHVSNTHTRCQNPVYAPRDQMGDTCQMIQLTAAHYYNLIVTMLTLVFVVM